MIDVAKLHDSADILRDCYPGEAQHEAIKAPWMAHDELLKANNNLCAQLAEVVIERDRLRAANKDCMAWFEDAKHEAQMANDALKLYRADRDYAHRLAVMLECVLLGGKGTWDEGHALLEEYREACRIESNKVATCMGEPVADVRAHVRADELMCPRPINTGPAEQLATACIALGHCGCLYGHDLTPNGRA